MLKSYGVGWWGGGGPCDFSVSPSPFGLDFGTLDFGTSDSGLTKKYSDLSRTQCYEKTFSVCLPEVRSRVMVERKSNRF